MISNCKRYVIVFNGEIYNFEKLRLKLKKVDIFNSASDTEVLLAGYKKYKEKILIQLRGMFLLFGIKKEKNYF